MAESSAPKRSRIVRWLRRIGIVGFLFFLVKGLLWLLVPAVIALFSSTR